MSFSRKVIARLSDQAQDRIVGWLVRTGLFLRVPMFQMLFRSMAFFGADTDLLLAAFSRARDIDPSMAASLRAEGKRFRESALAAVTAGDKDSARTLYRQAALTYLVADWFSADRQAMIENYASAMPCFDRFRALSEPAIEKIEFPFPVGSIKAHLRLPVNGDSPAPAVVLVQGDDTVKEWLVAFEDMALARGMATLNVEQPGWGESGLSGNHCQSSADLRACMHPVVDHLEGCDRVRSQAIGIFGVSLGGLLAPYCAGLEPRFTAVAGLGGVFSVNELWRNLPAIQRRRTCRYTGLDTLPELLRWFEQLDIEGTLERVRCPALVVHGSKDEMALPQDAHALAAAMGGQAHVKIVQGGDHMCSQFLADSVGPHIFDWLADRLGARARGREKPG